jgi:curli biogenesis system outer membrane secretion channel CsgG
MRTVKLISVVVATAVAVSAMAGSVMPDKKYKMRIAVAPLNWGADNMWDGWQVPIEFRNAIHEKLQKKLMDTGRFIVLERAALEAVLQEQAIKEENTGQSQKGKIVPAQVLVQGKVTDFEMSRSSTGGGINIGGIGKVGGNVTQAKMSMNVRIFNVDTSELIATEDAAGRVSRTGFKFDGNHRVAYADFEQFEKTPLGEATTQAVNKAVEKILAKMEKTPWSCRIADFDASSKEITLNAGSEIGVASGDTFDVYKVARVIKDPETGEILGTKTVKIGTIKVGEVEKKFSFASVVSGEGFETGCIVREAGK